MSLPRFGVIKPVPVNLLMVAFLASGIACGLTMTREFFPETTPQSAIVSLPYPGATPEEIVAAMLYLCSEDANLINGAVIPLYGGG